ncbi:MAG: hypothetical protein ABI318_09550 [Chthoniobacteraceae bacterium]
MPQPDPHPSPPLKRFLARFVPFLYRPLRRFVHSHRGRRFHIRYQALVKRITARAGLTVQSGPFAGMRYLEESCSSALLPKLIGTYEDELHPTIEALLRSAPSAVVDIGCAEGYYAVGMAMRLPGTTVHAYDMDSKARSLCGELGRLNGVAERVLIHQQFTPACLPELPSERLLVICDVDGYEVNLFSSESAAHWRQANLIVELHDFQGLPCLETVRNCLVGSHRIELLSSRTKTPPSLQALEHLSEADRKLAVDELRPTQQWLVAITH